MGYGAQGRVKFLAILAASLMVVSGAGVSIAGEKGHHDAHWGYEGEYGPSHWGGMSKEYATCGSGKSQSPIDISGAEEKDLPDIVINYKESKLNIKNNGHTIQVDYDSGSSIKVDGGDYQLAQFHFHDPSEHTVNGRSFPMELHIVHKNEKGGLAVIGVILEEGSENPAYAKVFAEMPKKADEEKKLSVTVNASDLLPKSKAFYRYAGSLTTPPCTEDVAWFVLKTPVEVSKAQVDAFKAVIKDNNRPLQPLHGRKIMGDSSAN
jgi:carbonic anhydrase